MRFLTFFSKSQFHDVKQDVVSCKRRRYDVVFATGHWLHITWVLCHICEMTAVTVADLARHNNEFQDLLHTDANEYFSIEFLPKFIKHLRYFAAKALRKTMLQNRSWTCISKPKCNYLQSWLAGIPWDPGLWLIGFQRNITKILESFEYRLLIQTCSDVIAPYPI